MPLYIISTLYIKISQFPLLLLTHFVKFMLTKGIHILNMIIHQIEYNCARNGEWVSFVYLSHSCRKELGKHFQPNTHRNFASAICILRLWCNSCSLKRLFRLNRNLVFHSFHSIIIIYYNCALIIVILDIIDLFAITDNNCSLNV